MARDKDILVGGERTMSLYHHDGKFVRGRGVFAFSRQDLDGHRTIFWLEAGADISPAALPGHPAWAFAISRGMNEVLVRLGADVVTSAVEAAVPAQPGLRWELFDGEGGVAA
jgi:hypothetical protein